MLIVYPPKKIHIKEDRKVMLISDVDALIPEKLKKLFSFVEEIIETDEKTLMNVYERIEESNESIDYIYSLIEHALKIRPFNTKSLLSLHSLLAQKHGYKNQNIKDGQQCTYLLSKGISYEQNKKEYITQEDEFLVIF